MGMFAGHHFLLFSRAIGIVHVQFFGIQFMLIVLFRRYVSVIWLPLFCVALWDVHGCLALPVDCIRLVKLFTNDGWLCLYYFLTSLVQSFGCIKYVQVYFIIFMHASI